MEDTTLKEYFDLAGPDTRNLITSPSFISITDEIGKKYVGDEKKMMLRNEILLILLGIEPLNAFRANLINELEVSYDQALKISSETNTRIFGRVMNDLKNLEKRIAGENAETENKVIAEKKTQEPEEIPKQVSTPQKSPPIPTQLPKIQTPPPQTQKPAPQPPKNLPTQGNIDHILVRPTEIPVYKLEDHAHMTQEHTHTPTITPSSSTSAPSHPPPLQTIIDQKLSQVVKLPKEEITVDLDDIEAKRKTAYRGADPYREPIE